MSLNKERKPNLDLNSSGGTWEKKHLFSCGILKFNYEDSVSIIYAPLTGRLNSEKYSAVTC